jgi:hypothetical protein
MIRCNIVEGLRHLENRQANRMAIALGSKSAKERKMSDFLLACSANVPNWY